MGLAGRGKRRTDGFPGWGTVVLLKRRRYTHKGGIQLRQLELAVVSNVPIMPSWCLWFPTGCRRRTVRPGLRSKESPMDCHLEKTHVKFWPVSTNRVQSTSQTLHYYDTPSVSTYMYVFEYLKSRGLPGQGEVRGQSLTQPAHGAGREWFVGPRWGLCATLTTRQNQWLLACRPRRCGDRTCGGVQITYLAVRRNRGPDGFPGWGTVVLPPPSLLSFACCFSSPPGRPAVLMDYNYHVVWRRTYPPHDVFLLLSVRRSFLPIPQD